MNAERHFIARRDQALARIPERLGGARGDLLERATDGVRHHPARALGGAALIGFGLGRLGAAHHLLGRLRRAAGPFVRRHLLTFLLHAAPFSLDIDP